MRILRSFAIAFSMYSRIPMPRFTWKEKDMRYALCFFPWVGAVIGGVLYGWMQLCGQLQVGILAETLVAGILPLTITGGFHADGFMDTMDALCSYQSREKRIEILKDPHIGAFSVIRGALWGMLYLASYSEIRDKEMLGILCAGFFLSRCLSGISVLWFPKAKKEGMLYGSAEKSERWIVTLGLSLQGAGCICFMLVQSAGKGCLVSAVILMIFLLYYGTTKRVFGGITGDTAGFFVVVSEIGSFAAAAISGFFI